MSKEELKAKLDEAGVKYDGRWGEKKLAELLPKEPEYTEEVIENIADAIVGKDKKPADVILSEITTRPDGERQTKSGIIVPTEATKTIRKTQWTYFGRESEGAITVFRKAQNGYQEEIRTYSLERHGDKYLELSAGFVDKRNRIGY